MSSTKTRSASLTDTHLLILSGAAQRGDRSTVRPPRMTERAFARAAKLLLARGLIEDAAAPDERQSGRSASKSNTLRITAAGLIALGIEPDPTSATEPREAQLGRGRKRSARPPARQSTAAPVEAAVKSDVDTVRPATKRAQIQALLARRKGASLAELIALTGWLPHTTRAALTGLRQRGCTIEGAKAADGTTIYRIIGADTNAALGGTAR